MARLKAPRSLRRWLAKRLHRLATRFEEPTILRVTDVSGAIDYYAYDVRRVRLAESAPPSRSGGWKAEVVSRESDSAAGPL